MSQSQRAIAREIAHRHLTAGDLLGWFEELYARAAGDASIIPWADLTPNPNFVSWLDQHQIDGDGRAALKVGCGLGDDAEELTRRGFRTTAFDISPSAIAWCKTRYPKSVVSYVAADLLHAPLEWRGKFDFVLESYTLQVLPPKIRREAIEQIASFVACRGTLLVIARGREPSDPEGNMPWPLTKDELEVFRSCGLSEVHFEDYLDNETPPVRRFRVTYRKDERGMSDKREVRGAR
jgi:SAM-dependent methyltransferase